MKRVIFSPMNENRAIVYCDKAFLTATGKTAHGLVRFTERYQVVGVIDSNYANQDAGKLLDGKPNGIKIFSSLADAQTDDLNPTHFVIGLAPDGGRLSGAARDAVKSALLSGLNVHSGLHDFLSDDEEFVSIAKERGCELHDVRKTPPRSQLHSFTGKINDVDSLKIAVLGTDAALGKRTTTVILKQKLIDCGISAELIGTGQTSWLQGAPYSFVLDSTINDFVAGEIEHAVWSAWQDKKPQVILIDGQGSLLHPAYPGGFEILGAARPDGVLLQHAPARKVYDGFEDFAIPALKKQLAALRAVSSSPVIGITLNHENLEKSDIDKISSEIANEHSLPAQDLLWQSSDAIVEAIKNRLS